MAFSLITHKTAAGAGVATAAADTTTANFLVAGLADYHGLGSTLVDSKSNTWVGNTGAFINLNNKVKNYHVVSPTTDASHTAQANNGFPALGFTSWSGAKAASAFDQENGATATSATSLSTGSVTPSQDNELIIATICIDGSFSNLAIDSGFTLLDQVAFQSSVNYGMGIAYLIQTSAGAVNPQWTWTTSRNVATTITTYKDASTGANTSRNQAAMF